MKFCPQCGTVFEPDARFCLECGFDRSTVETVVSGSVLTPGENTVENIQTPEPKPVCPGCGTELIPGDRFCLECGFDTTGGKPVFEPVEQPVVKPAPIHTPPVTENAPPPQITQQPKPVIPPVREPDLTQTPLYANPVNAQGAGNSKKSKKPWLFIVLAVIVIAALGAGGWFVYTKYMDSPKPEPVDTTVNFTMPELPDTATSVTQPEIAETPAEISTGEPKTTTKPKSRVDQELAKYREKEKNKTAQATPAQQSKAEPGVKISSNGPANDNLAKVIHEVGRKEDPKSKKPKNPAKLTLQKQTMIVRITTDHYNEGMGTSGGGTITIKDRDGNVMGTYKAFGRSGNDGTPNAKWVAEPHKMLDKGTYYIWDSDFSTWSKNFLGNGFIVVEGYDAE